MPPFYKCLEQESDNLQDIGGCCKICASLNRINNNIYRLSHSRNIHSAWIRKTRENFVESKLLEKKFCDRPRITYRWEINFPFEKVINHALEFQGASRQRSSRSCTKLFRANLTPTTFLSRDKNMLMSTYQGHLQP